MGNKCIRCGIDDWRILQVDHINNDGNEERRRVRLEQLYKKILEMNNEELNRNYQLLCANCNWIKKYENKEGTKYEP